jgi:hypothetical protein
VTPGPARATFPGVRGAALLVAILGLAGPAAAAEPGPRPIAAARGGVLVVASPAPEPLDPRPRQLAAAFVAKGVDSFVARELLSPAPDAEARLDAAARHLEEARGLRRVGQHARAGAAAAAAEAELERGASNPRHLATLVETLMEQGAAARALGDAATAETMFLEALALDPRYAPDPDAYDPADLELLSDVRRTARQLNFAALQVDAPRLPGAQIQVDFGPLRTPPYETKLSDSAPGRRTQTVAVNLRAGRQTEVALVPGLPGDDAARAAALAALDPAQPGTVVALAGAAGTRFVLAAALTSGEQRLTLFDGRTGQAAPLGPVVLSAQPSPAELSAGIDQLLQAALLMDDEALEGEGDGSWYTSWWGITLISVVVAGAAAGTAVALTRGGDVEYRFEP